MIDNPFWQHSLKRYAQHEIAATCLQWQTDFQSNTNLILLGDWLGAKNVIVPDAVWHDIVAHVELWHMHVVLPLRKLRMELKSQISDQPIAELRNHIKRDELLAEQIMQSRLYEYCKSHIDFHQATRASVKECVAHNIGTYLRVCCGVDVNEKMLSVFL